MDRQIRIAAIDREDRALQRCNLSARSMPGDGQEHGLAPMLLPSPPSFGSKAVNLPSWGEAPSQANIPKNRLPVGHMSTFVELCAFTIRPAIWVWPTCQSGGGRPGRATELWARTEILGMLSR